MENKKAKGLIIVLLMILSLICLGIIIWQYLKVNNNISSKNDALSNMDNTQTNQAITNKPENENNSNKEVINQVQNNTQKEENKIAPYENYKHLNWSTISASAGTITSANIKIVNNKVYVTYDEVATEVTGIEGTPIKVSYTPSSILWFEVLTKEGKVYSVSDRETKAELYISEYDIIDMTTYAGEGPVTPNYYLTADGRLIDENGKEQNTTNNDPYSNFKNIKWGSINAESKTGASISITKGKEVYIEYQNNEKKVTGIEGTPVKVTTTIGGGIPFFYILTEECKIYNLEEWDSEATLVADLSKYNVIDMTPHINGNDTYQPMCFLTRDGKLIDSNGKNY